MPQDFDAKAARFRERAKAQGYSSAEIESLVARKRSESAASTDTGDAMPATPMETPLSGRDLLAARARNVIGQGALMGFGEEIEAGLRAIGPSTYSEEVKRLRQQMKQYREEHPAEAIAGEIAGGMLTGGAAALRSAGKVAATTGARALAKTLAQNAIAQGAIGGAGQAEGGLGSRLAGAVVGGTVGGVVGAAGGRVAQALGTRAARGGRAPSIAVETVERLMERERMTPGMLATRAQEMAATTPDARMLDVLGTSGVRKARDIRTLGGEAGAEMERAMAQRAMERPTQMQEALTRSTGRGRESAVATVEDLVDAREKAATKLYEALHAQGPVVDDALEAFISSRPSLKNAVGQAQKLMEEKGIKVQSLDMPEGAVPLRTPAFLDHMKQALDERIFLGKQPGPGGLGPHEMRALRDTRKKFVAMLDERLPGYREAREAYAGPTALKNAYEEGLESGISRTKSPDELRKTVADLSASEREFYRRGTLENMRQMIDDGRLSAKIIRTPAFEQRIKAVYGDQSGDIVSYLRGTVQQSEAANTILSGSQTLEKGIGVAEEIIPTRMRQVMRAVTSPKQSVLGALESLEERVLGAKAARQRVEKGKVLLTPASDIGAILGALEREYGTRRIGRQTGRVMGTTISRALAAPAVRAFQPEEQ